VVNVQSIISKAGTLMPREQPLPYRRILNRRAHPLPGVTALSSEEFPSESRLLPPRALRLQLLELVQAVLRAPPTPLDGGILGAARRAPDASPPRELPSSGCISRHPPADRCVFFRRGGDSFHAGFSSPLLPLPGVQEFAFNLLQLLVQFSSFPRRQIQLGLSHMPNVDPAPSEGLFEIRHVAATF
jgi:hypothetical protein